MEPFYAHSGENSDKSDWQFLEDHLRQVANRAEAFASAFKAGQWGATAGWLHDAGKATQAFQRRLEGELNRVDHSTFGARVAMQEKGSLGPLLAYVITGHHGGLPNGGIQASELQYRLKNGNVPDDAALLSAADIGGKLIPPFKELSRELAGFRLAFFTRMLFSCLVDADFLDTEAFCSPERADARPEGDCPAGSDQLPELKTALDLYLDRLCHSAENTPVNQLRRQILEQCRQRAKCPRQIFSLSVPTGGGKTLSSLSFALNHAAANGLRRIIYAIPFTSIIEQNAGVFGEILGYETVLEHHCNYEEKDRPEAGGDELAHSLATENWDAPLVVTTNVQFFESLFSHKPSRCRKLHNIAGSVIVLDEAQAIPTPLLDPCLAALNELVENYGCSVVLCTATQPAFDDAENLTTALPKICEVVEDPRGLYQQLRRTQVHFIGKMTEQQLAQRLEQNRQSLCIVGTKAQARALFERLKADEGKYHLSTNMYPVHRRRVLSTVRTRLKEGKPCRLISTSLVEAGVDLDFPVVFRAMAGLDSIAQAAGRCNREGRLQDNGMPCPGQVYVYEPEEPPAMPWLSRCASRAKEVLRSLPEGTDPIGLDAMQRFFSLLYDIEDTDGQQIMRLFPSAGQLTEELILPFKTVGETFRFIEDESSAVVIPVETEARELVRRLRHMEASRHIFRRLQQFSVPVRRYHLDALYSAGAVEVVAEQIPVLCNLGAYDTAVGLCADKAMQWNVEDMIL